MKTQVRHSTSPPNKVDRDEIYIHHDPDSNTIFGLWAGTKNDKRRCIAPRAVARPGDGNNYQMKAHDRAAHMDTTTSVATVTLPDVSEINDGHIVYVHDVGDNAGVNAITIATEGSETTDVASIGTDGATQPLQWDKANTNWVDIS